MYPDMRACTSIGSLSLVDSAVRFRGNQTETVNLRGTPIVLHALAGIPPGSPPVDDPQWRGPGEVAVGLLDAGAGAARPADPFRFVPGGIGGRSTIATR